MAPLVVDNGTMITLEGLWTNGRAMDNVLFYHRNEGSAHDAALDVMNNWQDHIVEVFLNNYTFQGARFIDMNSLDGEIGYIPADVTKTRVGSGVSTGTPPALCVLVHKNITSARGKRAGRIYLGPPQENQVDEDGNFDAGVAATYAAQFADFYDGTNDPTGYVAVLHAKTIGESSWSEVQSYSVDPLLAVQRRRMGR